MALYPHHTFLLIQELSYGKNHGPRLPQNAQIDYMSQHIIQNQKTSSSEKSHSLLLAIRLSAYEEGWKTFDRGRAKFDATSLAAIGSLPQRISRSGGGLQNTQGFYGRDNRGFLLRRRVMAGRVSRGISSTSVLLIFWNTFCLLWTDNPHHTSLFTEAQSRRFTTRPSRFHRGREELKEILRPYVAEA